MLRRRVTRWTALAGALALGACEQRATLDPAVGTEQPDSDQPGLSVESAVRAVEGVKVIASSEGWTGDAAIREEVTPFRVVIDNTASTHDVAVSFESFYLLDDDGERYSALPPFEVEGEAPAPQLAVEYDDFDEEWIGESYVVYDVYDPLYGEDVILYEAWDYDPTYYTHYYTYWDDTELPTADMLAKALPEGVVQAGGKVEGWMYFEEIDADEERLEFRAELIDASTGQRIGQVSIPFSIEQLE